MSYLSATDHLEGAALSIDLPSSVVDMESVGKLLGLSWSARRGMRALSNGLTRVRLKTEAWEWQSEEHDYVDSEGETQSYETKTDLAIDEAGVGGMPGLMSAASRSLRALGVPHDLVFTNGIDGSEVTSYARIDPADPHGACLDATPEGLPSFREIKARCAQSSSLDEFRVWLGLAEAEPAPLELDAKIFEASLGEPGKRAHIEACAGFLQWSKPWGAKTLEWDARASAWMRSLHGGEDPLARLARVGFPRPKEHLSDMLAMGLAQEEPDEALVKGCLNAFCAVLDVNTWRKGVKRISVGDAMAIAGALERFPHFLAAMPAEGLAVFGRELEELPEGAPSSSGYARAEARWLGLQSRLANPGAKGGGPRVKSL